MKLQLFCLAVIGVSLCAWSQAPASPGAGAHPSKPKVSPFAEYAGEWTATFDGKVWLRLHLELRGDQLLGALLRARKLAVNDNGDLKSVGEDQSGATITSAVINPDGLVLTTKDADSPESDRYLMRLVNGQPDAADLKMIEMTMPPGMPKPKPWRLVRSASNPTNQIPASR